MSNQTETKTESIWVWETKISLVLKMGVHTKVYFKDWDEYDAWAATHRDVLSKYAPADRYRKFSKVFCFSDAVEAEKLVTAIRHYYADDPNISLSYITKTIISLLRNNTKCGLN